jgi:hypothetical protein
MLLPRAAMSCSSAPRLCSTAQDLALASLCHTHGGDGAHTLPMLSARLSAPRCRKKCVLLQYPHRLLVSQGVRGAIQRVSG